MHNLEDLMAFMADPAHVGASCYQDLGNCICKVTLQPGGELRREFMDSLGLQNRIAEKQAEIAALEAELVEVQALEAARPPAPAEPASEEVADV